MQSLVSSPDMAGELDCEDFVDKKDLGLKRYELIDRLAVGGMAEIFLARQLGLEGFERIVVIKRIRPELAGDQRFVRMFLEEAHLGSRLNHSSIVQVYDLGKLQETYFMAMEYIFGRDMRRVMRKSKSAKIPFPVVYAMKVASSVCEGLHYAHKFIDARGNKRCIVHSDISPENIFVSFEGTVKILDFGVATDGTQSERRRSREIRGKVSYMSPEQVTGRPLDARSDIFSLGSALYEWITGFRLFTGDDQEAVLKAISVANVHAPSFFNVDVPESAENILMKALERDPNQRYQSAWEMQYDIDQFLAGYDFTPSNIHLSNFLKQLFGDELEEERERWSREGTSLAGNDFEASDEEAAPDEQPRQVRVLLEPEEHDWLEEVAKRNDLSPGDVLREMLNPHLRFR